MNTIYEYYRRFGPKKVLAAVAGLALIVLAIAFFFDKDTAEPETEQGRRSVAMIAVAELKNGAIGLTAPTADGRAFVVRAESGGQVRSAAKPGQVAAGSVIVELDNASERAALLQAEGAYEAALAAAKRSNISVADAETSLAAAKQGAVNADQAALTAWTSVLNNTVDELFSSPRSSTPGVRIDAGGMATTLNDERVALETILNDWQQENAGLSPNADSAALTAALEASISRTNRLGNLVDSFITLIPRHKADVVFTESELTRLGNAFTAARTALNGQKAALESARTALTKAEDALQNAEVGGTTGEISAANAQIKQALGAYQSVKAAYDKTIVRAPFAGTVTSINVRMGDIVSTGADIAIIVPENGAVTETFFDLPLSAVKFTPEGALVFTVNADGVLEAVPVKTGLVTAAAIRVTGLSGEEQIVADVRGLQAGDMVTVQ